MDVRRPSWDSRVDYSLILPVFFLLLIGLVAVYIAVSHDYPTRALNIVLLQGLWVLLGIVFAFVIMFFNKEFLWKATPFLYLLGIGMMFLPLFFYSSSLVAMTGAKNWVTLNGQTLFQPSEFMKISYILMMAYVVVRFHEKHSEASLWSDILLLVQLLVVTLPVLGLLYFQSDLGTALVFMAIFSGIVLLSGISWTIILPVVLLAGLFTTTFILIFISPNGKEILHNLGIDTYQLNRIAAWLDPFENAQTTTFQQAQSLIAIGSGGLMGQGFNMTNLHVPVRESDMIFTVIGEDFGFVGGLVVISLYMLLIYRMIRVTIVSNNRFYTFISTGFIMMILFHVFENIGAATGILPLTGIPLPFISQGGSSIISNLIGVGLVLSMSYQNSLLQEKRQQHFQRKHRFIIETID
ncbi:FtsW/RodA/SpoVE family cell cycle protein [Streptococcus ovuberis]|uniref:FtsW/RodA/SpoVE family cell cycle protein n=1 Tax=Streptococcus ovuberis TaxID=1936207 RepID=A0A7X6N1A6_9STRE|nr:FtsW/RodA/SpoVE family cell cycle protein [Streptococcus ovuberis]NKZ21118.1 FtsW/RodA/SpoVE family cell cycle protein [Streptococcus ovuberis]